MNEVMELLLRRRSVRSYDKSPIADDAKDQILAATMRAPTAGNMMLYSVIEVADQSAKETLARTCDNQPFIARAPLLLLFLADYQRTYDYFVSKGVPEYCERRGETMRTPQEGDLMLACCDAVIAAHTAVIAAESLGIGSCYIGDIMENYETHRDLFALPEYAFPICLICFGYPKSSEENRPLTSRFARPFIAFRDRYRRLSESEFDEMYSAKQSKAAEIWSGPLPVPSVAQLMYERKFGSEFAAEMNRSVRAMLEAWSRRNPLSS
ncbi:MAG: nitroreductase family protein [Candidatus Eisenbacteria bacterium]|nr:nitroreductase family protein [Candidatus Eisenbacteria bacterium]